MQLLSGLLLLAASASCKPLADSSPEAFALPDSYAEPDPYYTAVPDAYSHAYAQTYAYAPVDGAYVSPAVAQVLSLPVVTAAEPAAPAAPVVVAQPAVTVPVSSQHHAQSELGEYSYGYSNVNSAKVETKTADGVTRGSYSYVDANNVLQTAHYVSDPVFGFRVSATNIPVAPAAPEVAPVAEVAPVVTTKVINTEEPVENSAVPVDIVEAAPVVDGVADVVFPAVAETVAAAAPGEEVLVSSFARPAPGFVPGIAVANPGVVVPAAAPAPAITYAAHNPYLTYAPTYTHSVVPVVSAPTKTQFHIQDEFGQYRFGYAEPSANREEIRLADGTVTGTYNYVDDGGHIQTVQYVADALGFRVAGTNIPVAEALAHPVPVAETPEVVEARLAHLNYVAPALPAAPAETPEVVEARLQHAQAVADLQASQTAEAVVVAKAAPAAAAAPVAVTKEAVIVEADPKAEPIQIAPAPVAPVVVPAEVLPGAAPAVIAVGLPLASTQHHAQDEYGQYTYGYSNEDSSKVETKTADGIVRGSYSYIDADNVVQRVDYISDALGFRVAATNLPVAHDPVPASEVTLNKVPVAQVAQAAAVAESAPVLQEVHQVLAPAASAFPYEIDPTVIAAPAKVEAVPAEAANLPVVVPINVEALPAAQPVYYSQDYYSYAPSYYGYAGYAPSYYGGSYVHPQVVSQPAVPVAQPAVAAVPSVPVSSQHHAQSELGEYNYGYANVNSNKIETKTADGVTRGSYSYVDANNVVQTVNYIADDVFGFRVAATNLPVAPVAPEVAPLAPVEEH